MGPLLEVRRGLIPLAAILSLLSTIVHAAEEPYPPDEGKAEGRLGTWIGGQSTLRLTDRLSGFVQGEVRTWNFFHELNETLFRVAGSYKIAPFAWGAMGYVRVDTWPVDAKTRYQEDCAHVQVSSVGCGRGPLEDGPQPETKVWALGYLLATHSSTC